jgi:hypothetical protein
VAPAIVFSLSLSYLDQSCYAMRHDIQCEPAYILPVDALSTFNCRANTYYNMSFDSPIHMYGTELYVTPYMQLVMYMYPFWFLLSHPSLNDGSGSGSSDVCERPICHHR